MNKSPLNYFEGNLTDEYYVIRPKLEDSQQVDANIRSGPMICFNGEPDLEKMMKSDFRNLARPDCALKFNWVFRWAWESWRIVVGNRIGKLYPTAVAIMNAGARGKGEDI